MTQVTNTVRFVLDGQIVEAQGERRTTTVLDHLREELQRTGTKEGCAEGDCGACVVLVGELNAAGDGVDYVPVNACIQLLPSLDGKSVKTIESLKKPDGTLHPVQDAMVKCHGSQCGFCTPGIVMSLAHLARYASAAEALQAAQHQPPPCICPENFVQDGETILCYPGDPRHSVPTRALPGPTRLRYSNKRFEPINGFEALFLRE